MVRVRHTGRRADHADHAGGEGAPVCTPFQDFATDAESKWVCESCRQWYYLDVGLPEGVSFDDCVDNALSRARARREKATPQNKASAR